MPYKTFTAGTTLPSADVQSYLMNQAVIVCTSATRPASPVMGMVIYETDTGNYQYCQSPTGPIWGPIRTRLTYATSTASLSTTTTTFIKDTGCGDIVVVSPSATQVYWRVRYVARPQSDTAAATVDFRIYDGGASSPTTASTLLTGASMYLDGVGLAAASMLECEEIVTLSVGTHTLAAFYGRTNGAGNVRPAFPTGPRLLSAEMLVAFQ